MSVVTDLCWLLAENAWHLFVASILLWVSPLIFVWQKIRAGPRKQFKSILITGGNAGLGEYLAKAFAAPGVQLVLLARRTDKLESVAQQCRALGASVECVAASVADKKQMNTELLRLDDMYSFDCVIANAGVSYLTLNKPHVEESMYDLLDINVSGVFNTTFPLLDRMRARKCGQIGIMSSLASFLPMPMRLDYHASKVAVRYFAEGLRPLVAADNVGVTTICPGFVRSPMTDETRKSKFAMPFFIDDTAQAAKIMKDALECNVGVCVFPYPLYLISSLGAWLPACAREWLLSLPNYTGPAGARLRPLPK